jgi:hypothetical protein
LAVDGINPTGQQGAEEEGIAMSDLYERDFYAWTAEQPGLLRAGNLSRADVAHIAEEIESMGRSEKRELVSRLTILPQHLLKWRFQPDRRSASWRLWIANTRDQLAEHRADNPSLRARLRDAMASAYRYARRNVAIETGFPEDTFPIDCPWTFEQAMQDEA